MEFNGFTIDSIGDLITEDRFGWVSVNISFTDAETNACPFVEIRVPIQYQRDWTLNQVREAAFQKAKQVLAAINVLLAQRDLEGLQQLADDLKEKRAREVGEFLSSEPPDE